MPVFRWGHAFEAFAGLDGVAQFGAVPRVGRVVLERHDFALAEDGLSETRDTVGRWYLAIVGTALLAGAIGACWGEVFRV